MAHGTDRRGFTLVETVATLALLCFVVAVLGPLLLRASRQSSTVTMGQYRTAALVGASSKAIALPFDLLASACVADPAQAFPHTTCTALVDTLPELRRISIVVTPGDTILSAPDTVVVYRVNSERINPFNSP